MAVRWRRSSSLVHTVTPTGHQEWQAVSMNSNGQTFQHTFSTAGTFPYLCEIHPGMSGTVVVQAGAPGGGNGGGNPNDPGYDY
jgi:plastocyanin